MSNRCTATHVVQCDGEAHEGPYHNALATNELYGTEWKDGDPQPRMEITDDMVKRAAKSFLLEEYGADSRPVPSQYCLRWMRAALDAALNGDKP